MGLRTAAALGSALLVVLALPKFGWTYLGLFGLAPLILALRGATPRQAAFLGGTFGLAQSLGVLYWISGVVEHYGHLPFWLAGLILLLLLALMAFYSLLWSLAVSFLWNRPGWFIWTGAAAWVGLEWVRSWFLTGFPWMDLGYVLTPWKLFVQCADLGGVALAGLLVTGLNLGLAQLLAGPRRLLGIILLAAAWGGAVFYGQARLDWVREQTATAPKRGCPGGPGQHQPGRKVGRGLYRRHPGRLFPADPRGRRRVAPAGGLARDLCARTTSARAVPRTPD